MAGGGEGEEESVIVAQYRTFCPLPLPPAKLPSTTVAVFLGFFCKSRREMANRGPFSVSKVLSCFLSLSFTYLDSFAPPSLERSGCFAPLGEGRGNAAAG